MRHLMTFTEYARHRKVSPPAITQAVASGRITVVIDAQGRRRLDPEIADQQWGANTDPLQSERASASRRGHGSPDGDGGEKGSAYWDARTLREQAEASIAEMRRRQMSSELCDVAGIQRAAATMGRLVRDGVLGVPSRIAGQLAPLTDAHEIEQRMTTALRQVLDDLEKMSAADLPRTTAAPGVG